MKVYTKTGDKGQTALIGGKRVTKNHPRIEAYGTVDELMAHTALLMDMLKDKHDKDFLLWILDRLMTASSVLAAEGDAVKKIPQVATDDITRVEQRIDEMESILEPMNSFILPGGHPAASQCHVARTVCRRAERKIIGLADDRYDVPAEVTGFINRLSDYFFVLSRKMAKDFNIIIKKWTPVVS
ncbi:MAG: cob(I)yrinic acid a,c-diamide adenosyltransferase [Dysgonamonadaceae bacterium]|jgi:cob(I)alamin adenosyltransferase|nr:cob(I)yrinic acid a,c-diamide adenosyltransferase [Dysgonamonadaceae bacterium]